MNIFRKTLIVRLTTLFLLLTTIKFNGFQSNVVLANSVVPDFQKNELLINGKDSESIVFLVVGDGFQEHEQELFNKKAAELKDYIIDTYPYNEMKNDMNFYTLNVISNESGAANNTYDLKDTFFQSSYNYAYNIERLLNPINSNAAFILANYYVPDFDYILMIVNDQRYGGSGGGYLATASINVKSYEIMLHEMGHSIGNLADEYWAGFQYAKESPNMTQEDSPLEVPWSDLIGINGIGVYPYVDDPTWYRPSTKCKMERLGKEYPYCEVCARVIKNSLADLRWQTHTINVSLYSSSMWAREAIINAIAKGFVPSDIMNNYMHSITRAEFCRMTVKYIEYITKKSVDELLIEKGVTRNQNAFIDTNDSDILAAYALGVTSGTGNGTFTPNVGFNREQAATMIANACKVLGWETDNAPAANFADADSISSWAVSSINFCYANKIMVGSDNKFNPQEIYTKEQNIVTFNNIK